MSESGSEKRSKVFNVPNTLSLVRVFLAPLVLLFLTIRITAPVKFLDNFNLIETPSWGDVLAGAVFIVAAITDS
ncbi:MAG: CDP-diacylglycerol--glycerol-3-phosphate 3-phosphatidyltransferase, partial [Synergistaceae bacterium]|nr:CDP-diacylglycerol--glycerol-3-phosphate 3-phosphatidyltransferase [Synergistaceae bacterium]